MKRVWRITKVVLKWSLRIVVLLVILLLAAMEGFDRYLATEKGAMWVFKGVNQLQKEIHYTESNVRYVSIGDPEKQALLLVHGAPGSVFDWMAVAKDERIYEKYRLLIVDRPGYGATKPRKPEKSVKIQAERILQVLDQEERPVVVMGHSYGAPIAIIMGALEPNKIEKIIGVSGQYNPDNEITFKISYAINFKLFKYILPRLLWVSNVEKLSHPDGLREVVPLYGEVEVPVELIHGDEDTLVYYENSPYLMKLLKWEKELTTLAGKDHPIHMSEANYLVDFVLARFKVPEPAVQDTLPNDS